MDAAKKKALFRSKLNAQRKEKKIDSPLVRYNELDQPVCRVCDVVLKSEFQWDAHQASRKHIEAINNIKVNAARLKNINNAKSEPSAVSTGSKHADNAQLQDAKSESLTQLPRPQSALPPDFFDNKEAKRQKTDAVKPSELDSSLKPASSIQTKATRSLLEDETGGLPSGNHLQTKKTEDARGITNTPAEISDSQAKKGQGALPEGFFDNKEADLRARGIKPVKPDVNDEYKEFEKLIQEDLREVDDRLEEEEVDAAETIEEAESLEQKTYRERVELLKKKKMELMAARASERSKGSEIASKESSHEDSSSDDDSDVNFAVDWRAQHL
ncbi:PREDICTED: zinc finger protein 830-like isoform X2 [Populus euphratica]|uniref:Zinc finger protein 830 n=1 Tax=Populus euphratica TaxID=75702 RepID=A0AAJ6Y0Q3_POPEU|nr:PREDICTED: zinc finger protein 830-like isoform X2 [Populus euphratica]